MRRISILLILTVFVSVFLFGCGKAPGEEYVGKWEKLNDTPPAVQIEIKRNGETFILARTAKSLWDGKLETKEFPAVFKDNILNINVGIATVTASFVKEDGTLLLEGQKYKRINK